MSRTVSKTRKDTSHLFHLVMTFLTAGLWGLFVWLPIVLWHKFGPRKRTVTYSPEQQQAWPPYQQQGWPQPPR